MEELLEAELLKVANKEKTIQVLGERKPCFVFLFTDFSEYHLILCVCLYIAFYVNFCVSIVQSCLFCHCQGFETGNRGSKRRNRKYPA